MSFPAKIRKSIAGEEDRQFIVTRGKDSDRCIEIYLKKTWEDKYEAKFSMLDQMDKDNRAFLRTISMWTDEVQLDNQQRLPLPKNLIDYAKIDGKITQIVMGDHIELWDPGTLENNTNENDDLYNTIARKLNNRETN
jgi:MraZ protein